MRLDEASGSTAGINALFGDRPFQVDERVELAEGGGRGRVGRIVGRHVHGLHRGDGPLVGRGDPFLQGAHFRGQRRLITHGATACGPSSADTSLPACEKRKMLSTNSSVSVPVVSRKYSAIVRADRATRRRAPGGSFIWPNTMQVCSMTLRPVLPIFGFLHFQPQVGPFAGPLADAGEHRVTAVRDWRCGRSAR